MGPDAGGGGPDGLGPAGQDPTGPGSDGGVPTGPSPADPVPGREGPARRRRWPVVAGIVATVLTFAATAGAFVQLPYDTIAPGRASEVQGLLSIEGHPTYVSQGQILFTTVSVLERINVYEYLRGAIDDTIAVVPEERSRGDVSPEDYRQLNVAAMADSKTVAELLALRTLGFTGLTAGARITEVLPDRPASPLLRVDDVIVEAGGRGVSSVSDAVAAIEDRVPGDVLSLVVERGGERVALEAELANDGTGGPLLGVLLSDEVSLPFEIGIDSGNVVGSSAGLAYALALIDYLTPGDLTGGAIVGVTGQLEPDGSVVAIGGAAQKAVTVGRAGASVFLVPDGNAEAARTTAPGSLRIVPVGSLRDALAALAELPGSNAGELLAAPAA